MIKYLNTKLNGKTETIDQLDSNDFKNRSEFIKAKSYLKDEYNLAGGHGSPYWSQRECK